MKSLAASLTLLFVAVVVPPAKAQGPAIVPPVAAQAPAVLPPTAPPGMAMVPGKTFL